MPEEIPTEQIRKESEARWTGFFAALGKFLPHLLAILAGAGVFFNGCNRSHDLTENQNEMKFLQQEIDQLKNNQ